MPRTAHASANVCYHFLNRGGKEPWCTSWLTNRVMVHSVPDQFSRCWLCPVRSRQSERPAVHVT